MAKRAMALVALVALGLLVAVQANAAGAVQVSGDQVPDGICGPYLEGTYTMYGSLKGCWYTTIDLVRERPSGTAQVRGTELFDGCLDLGGDGCTSGDPAGTISFSFQFSGKFETVFPYTEIRGRCQRQITSGTDGFAAASGVITFKDDVTTEPPQAPYRGAVRF